MALQVWLPLNKDGAVKNQGLANINITSTAAYSASGKLGGSYYFSGSSNWISFPSQPWMAPNNTNSISIAMWVKADSFNFIIAANAFEYKLSSSSFMWRLGNGGTNTFATVTSGITFTTGTWYHLCGTWDAKNKKLAAYVNGELVKELTSTLTSYNNISSTINLVYDGSWNINDFRFYDHCLSPKEVKEIAKGLVLHYPLNDAYMEETSNLFSADLTYHTNWNNSGSAIWNWNDNTIPKINNSIIYSISRTDTGNSTICCGRCNLVAGKTYTASVYVYLSGNTDSNIFYVRSVDTNVSTLKYNNDANPQKWPQNQWIRATATFTSSTAYNSCYICSYLDKANSKRALTCWQIEEKDHATPYTPSTRNETTVYDCSGYQNNGTITGSLSCVANSSRYKISTVFDGISSKIINDSFPTSIVSGTNSFTICGWAYYIKGNSYNPLFHIGSAYRDATGICLHGEGNRIEGLDINGTKINNTYGSGYSNEKWVHQCIVYDGTTIKRYLNGNSTPVQSIACPGFKSDNNKLCVGGFWGVPFKGYLSDFRIYATALSAEDIKELYNTSAYVSDNGTLLTYSVEE